MIEKTTSICPECKKNIPADIVEQDGKVYMTKSCPEHGDYKDRLCNDVDYYQWAHALGVDGEGISNYCVETKNGCPNDCGPCGNHKSSPCVAVIDVTNRCNLQCPICFANAAVAGYEVEPSFDEIVEILNHFRSLKPLPAQIAMFSGGEPTVRKDLAELILKAQEAGFEHTLVNSNGIKLANPEYFKKIVIDTNLTTIYLQFDGLKPETYIKTRGKDLTKYKMQVIENARKYGFRGIVLVPTIARDVSSPEVGDIIQFAVDNSDVIGGIIFQPVSLCGRIGVEELEKERYNTTDLIADVEKAVGKDIGPWYPISTLARFTRVMSWYAETDPVEFTTHPDCGFATVAVVGKVNGKKQLIPLSEYFDVMGTVEFSDKVWQRIVEGHPETWPEALSGLVGKETKAGKFIKKHMNKAIRNAVKAYFMANMVRFVKRVDVNAEILVNMLRLLNEPNMMNTSAVLQSQDTFMLGCMHFQDVYNLNVERVSRCIVQYGFIDPISNKPKHAPFCTMNTLHRSKLETMMSARRNMEKAMQEKLVNMYANGAGNPQ